MPATFLGFLWVFLLTRYLVRERVLRAIGKRPLFRMMLTAIDEDAFKASDIPSPSCSSFLTLNSGRLLASTRSVVSRACRSSPPLSHVLHSNVGFVSAICAVSNVSLAKYMLGSVLGTLLEMPLFVYAGSTMRTLADASDAALDTSQIVLIVVQVVVCVLLFIVMIVVRSNCMATCSFASCPQRARFNADHSPCFQEIQKHQESVAAGGRRRF